MRKLIMFVHLGLCAATTARPQGVTGKVFNSSSVPVRGYRVRIDYANQPSLLLDILDNWSGETDAGGVYHVSNVTSGALFKLYFFHSDYDKASRYEFHLENGFPTTLVNATFTNYFVTVKTNLLMTATNQVLAVDSQLVPIDMTTLVATGHLQNTAGGPVKYHEVLLMGGDRWLSIYSDTNGNFQAYGLAAGQWQAVAPNRAYHYTLNPVPSQPQQTVTIQSGQVAIVNFQIPE
jgi:hypothetical protein